MFVNDSTTDAELIHRALTMWRCYIQTGNPVLSTADVHMMGQPEKARQLTADQQEFVLRLTDLAAQYQGP